ncbi:MAG: hypothetical protein SFX74_09050 [Fimbriimonadaceae bacterium]|nr:hypothetical protein [Fimbriimonadaceae bacterium]
MVSLSALWGVFCPGLPIGVCPVVDLFDGGAVMIRPSNPRGPAASVVDFTALTATGALVADTRQRGLPLIVDADLEHDDAVLRAPLRALAAGESAWLWLPSNAGTTGALQVRMTAMTPREAQVYWNVHAGGTARAVAISRAPIQHGRARVARPLQK